jgi:hypothetical protein
MEYGPRLLLGPDGRRYLARVEAPGVLAFRPHQGGPPRRVQIPPSRTILDYDSGDLARLWWRAR